MYQSEKRRRVERACDACKRKKKQCSGSHPCTTCASRSRQCIFSNTPASKLDSASNGTRRKSSHGNESVRDGLDADSAKENGNKTAHEVNEPPLQNAGRLLQDGAGRLLYVGDSATLSFLQSIRRLVEGNLGPSAFTMDLNRHKIVEAAISTPPGYQFTYTLPDLETALYLMESFFFGTTGLFEIFDREAFKVKLLQLYEAPLEADSQWLSQVNLVFALGIQMRSQKAVPTPTERSIIDKLERGGVKRAEIFFLTAKRLYDPLYALEDGGTGAVQSLLLMTIFMLTVAKRNTAWVFLGMAVRFAYALGIHKEETLAIFELSEQDLRRKLWLSLYNMDIFLSSSLGRPSAISSACVTELCPKASPPLNPSSESQNDLSAAVAASKLTGDILSRVYQKRKASRSMAYALSFHFSAWMKDLPKHLQWRQMSLDAAGNPEGVLKRLHVNLVYFQGIILLTRPFLLYQISMQLGDKTGQGSAGTGTGRRESSAKKKPEDGFCFHGACVRAGIHAITAVHTVFVAEALPRVDPFVIYWLFSATLIILANKFCPVHPEPESDLAAERSLRVFHACSDADPHARRYFTILKSFHNTILERDASTKSPNGQIDGRDAFDVLFGGDFSQLGANAPSIPLGGDVDFSTSLPVLPGMEAERNGMNVQMGSNQGAVMGLNAGDNEVWGAQQQPVDTNYFVDFNDDGWDWAQEDFGFASVPQVPLYGLIDDP